nr:hypothetical protein GCM10020093_060440 [Planobispora longispora]
MGHVIGRLAERGKRTLLQLAAEAATLLGQFTGDLLEETEPRREPYRHIVVDEAQDLHPTQWRLLRAAAPYAPDDLFIVGDPHQRIFDTRVALGSVGIDASQRRLQVSYRLPQEILSWGYGCAGRTGRRAGGRGSGVVRFPRHAARPAPDGPCLRFTGGRAERSGHAHLAVVGGRRPPGEIGVAARTADLVREARAALRNSGCGRPRCTV